MGYQPITSACAARLDPPWDHAAVGAVGASAHRATFGHPGRRRSRNPGPGTKAPRSLRSAGHPDRSDRARRMGSGRDPRGPRNRGRTSLRPAQPDRPRPPRPHSPQTPGLIRIAALPCWRAAWPPRESGLPCRLTACAAVRDQCPERLPQTRDYRAGRFARACGSETAAELHPAGPGAARPVAVGDRMVGIEPSDLAHS